MGLEKDMGNEGCGGRPEKVTGQGREGKLRWRQKEGQQQREWTGQW